MLGVGHVLTAIFVMTSGLCIQLLWGAHAQGEFHESLRRGYWTNKHLEFLGPEKGTGGTSFFGCAHLLHPNHSTRSSLQLYQSLLSAALGVYRLAEFVVDESDMAAYAKDGSAKGGILTAPR